MPPETKVAREIDYRVARMAMKGYAVVRETNPQESGLESWSVIRTTSPTDRPSRPLMFTSRNYESAVTHAYTWAKEAGLA